MSINPVSTINPLSGGMGTAPVISLDERMNGLGSASSGLIHGNGPVSDADYQAFYAALLAAREGFDAQAFLRDYLSAEGEKTFNTTSAQMEVLQKVMAQLKAEGQQASLSYELASKAFSSAFSMNFMIQGFMREAMNPSKDEDSRENIEW
jgi:hypothetical protein